MTSALGYKCPWWIFSYKNSSRLTKLKRHQRPASEQDKFLPGVKTGRYFNLRATIWKKTANRVNLISLWSRHVIDTLWSKKICCSWMRSRLPNWKFDGENFCRDFWLNQKKLSHSQPSVFGLFDKTLWYLDLFTARNVLKPEMRRTRSKFKGKVT